MPRLGTSNALTTFAACAKESRVLAPGSILFAEGDAPTRMHLLSAGRVKLLGSTAHGKTLITKVAVKGELLGLNAIMLGRPYLVTAEAMDVVRVQYTGRDAFLGFVNMNANAARHVIRQLSTNYYEAQAELRALNLSGSAREKLARRFVDWIEALEVSAREDIWLDLQLTHEDIGQMIGASRETVTRLFSDWSRAGFIEVEKRAIRIIDLSAIRSLARL